MKYLSQLCYQWKRAKGYKREVGFVHFTQTVKMLTLVDSDNIYKYRYNDLDTQIIYCLEKPLKKSIQRYILKNYRLMKIKFRNIPVIHRKAGQENRKNREQTMWEN